MPRLHQLQRVVAAHGDDTDPGRAPPDSSQRLNHRPIGEPRRPHLADHEVGPRRRQRESERIPADGDEVWEPPRKPAQVRVDLPVDFEAVHPLRPGGERIVGHRTDAGADIADEVMRCARGHCR